MNDLKPKYRRQHSSVRLLFVLVVMSMAVSLPLLLKAAPPFWWTSRGVTDATKQANDYAAVNQGQVKFIAEQAVAEMDAHLPGGAGDALHQMVSAWGTPTATTNDYSAVNLGQLKVLAQPFYDQLISVGYTNVYPWNGSLAQANDYAAANIGQVKNLFSFNLTYDGDADGLPDWWEMHWFGHLGVSANALAARGDGLTNLQAYQQGLNPLDYYNGHAPTLAIAGGNTQTGPPNGFVPLPLLVSAADGNGNLLINAPVTFTVTSGGGQVQKSSIGTPSTSITMITDYTGQAKAFFQLPNVQSNTSTITATPGSGAYSTTLTFTESSDGGNGSYASPFNPSNVVATMNSDMSADVSWTNNADPADMESIDIRYKDKNGAWQVLQNVPAGTTSYHISAPQ